MKHIYLLTLCCLYFTSSLTQDLSGTWQGIYNNFKMVLVQKGDSLFGYTYDTGLGFCEANFIGYFKSTTKLLKGENTSFIRRTASHSLSSYMLNYSTDSGGEYLKGTIGAKGTVMKIMSFGMRERVAYKKVSNEVDSTDFMINRLKDRLSRSAVTVILPSVEMQDNVAINEPTKATLTIEKEKRTTNLFKRIETSADSITLRLYDNGTIDDDTVTVFYNGKIILNKLGLTAQIVEIKIPVNESFEIQKIELMANNLGSIPPNTANLEILAGKDKYTLRVSADLKVNAGIEVLYKKE